jgi:plasmid stability protein
VSFFAHAIIDSIASPRYSNAMPTLTIRNVPERVHQAIRRRAAENARSVEAEVRALLENAATAPATDWRREIADIQRRSRKALGDPPKGAVKRFVVERAVDWGEE